MDHTLALRSALQSGAAETQLALIAEQAGDQQLAQVIAEFHPAEIAVMVRDADMTKPSLAHAFITPDQFIGAFGRIGSRWGEIPSNVDYVTFQRDVEDFLCPMILAAEDPERRATMVRELAGHELCVETLLFLTLGHSESPSLLAHPHGYPFVRGTWQELLGLFYEYQGETFREVAAMALEVQEEGDDGAHRFAHSLLRALYDEARTHQATETTATQEEEFVDI